MLVLDASVAMAWGLPDESSEFAQQVLLEVQASGARVPSLWVTELLNGALMAERRKRFTMAEAEQFLHILATLHQRRKITVVEFRPTATFVNVAPLARKHGLTAYDATYLYLAASAALPLATTDKALKAAAKQMGVKLWTPAA
jgi:predicted nucleic acid-binding protein